MSLIETFELGMDRLIPNWMPNANGIILNLGAGNKSIPGAVDLDLPEWDADIDAIPYTNESINQIHAYHFLEHVNNPVAILLECQRVLKPLGHMNIVVPYYNSQMQAHDLDHKSAFCEDTWKILFNTPYYNKNKIDWHFKIGTNIIMGIVERNLCLITQLIKEPK